MGREGNFLDRVMAGYWNILKFPENVNVKMEGWDLLLSLKIQYSATGDMNTVIHSGTEKLDVCPGCWIVPTPRLFCLWLKGNFHSLLFLWKEAKAFSQWSTHTVLEQGTVSTSPFLNFCFFNYSWHPILYYFPVYSILVRQLDNLWRGPPAPVSLVSHLSLSSLVLRQS